MLGEQNSAANYHLFSVELDKKQRRQTTWPDAVVNDEATGKGRHLTSI